MLKSNIIGHRLFIRAALSCVFFYHIPSHAQVTDTTVPRKIHIVVAGEQYYRSSFHHRLWGKHYRKEWKTPITVPVFFLDSTAGGLTPYQAGGGRQSKTLRLRNFNEKEYVLRSIDKTFGRALPEIYQGTWVERLINDQVSIAHPYAAVTIPVMADAAKIYHTYPSIVYVPRQPALDSFNKKYGNELYLFEQRPDENWVEADNFGNSKNIIGTEKLFENLGEDNNKRVDQLAYVRTRLFDILIGDWGRHEDQWRWSSKKDGDETVYRPIPRDRDQAFTKFDGLLLGLLISAADLEHLQSFDHKIKDVRAMGFPARNLDRRLANEPTLSQWSSIARELQYALTDSVIENAIRQMPPEVFPVSGPDMIAKLKSRRNDLEKYAVDYYKFLAEEVEIVGTEKNEYFEIIRLDNDETKVNVYRVDGKGNKIGKPYYSRIFHADETNDIRIYGMPGKDVFDVSGQASRAINLRIIGGTGSDIVTDRSQVRHGKNVHVYDDHTNSITASGRTRLHLSNDSSIHRYYYDGFKYDEKGTSFSLFYSNADRFYVGLGYEWTKQQWRKEPFGYTHSIDARYSLTQKALSFTYKGTITQLVGKWDLNLYANYDFVRWTNFYGIGNETKPTGDRDYHIMRTQEVLAQAGLSRNIGKRSRVDVNGFYQTVQVIRDEDRFVGKDFFNGGHIHLYDQRQFAGAAITYDYLKVDDPVTPQRGIDFSTTASYTYSLYSNNGFGRYTANLNFYIPIVRNLVIAVRSGGGAMTGKAEFYQLNSIGGGRSLRGYRRDRFRGETTLFSDQELQWLFDVKSGLFNGKFGLIGLYDVGRVWQPGEKSNTWHTGYGGGILLAPFNKIMFSVTYAVSDELTRFHFRCAKPLFSTPKISK